MHHIGSDRINAVGMMKGDVSITKLSSNIVQYLNKKETRNKQTKIYSVFLVSRQYTEIV